MPELIRRFIEITREKGLLYAFGATLNFLRYTLNISRIRRKITLYRMRKQYGESVVRQVNDSLMELDISPNSPNKLERNLALKGSREPGATNTYQKILTELKPRYPSIHVFDVGANVGYFALMAANILEESGQIYALEAEPTNAERLQYNVELNNYSNITVNQIAAGAERTQKELSLRSESNIHRIAELTDDKDIVGTVDVEMYPIDQLISDYEIPREDLIIIRLDVEGYEANVFEGMQELFSSNRPIYLFTEIHPSLEAVNTNEIVELLNDHGFSAEYISPDGGNTYQLMDTLDEILELESNSHIVVSRLSDFREVERSPSCD